MFKFHFPKGKHPDIMYWKKNPQFGDYTTKLGYKAWTKVKYNAKRLQWWKEIWKVNAPLQIKITSQMILSVKLMTWDLLIK